MKTNELRIVNLVSSKCHNGLVTEIFSIIDSKNVRLGANPLALYKNDEIEPIQLTEEWLVKFGFVKINSAWYKFLNFSINISMYVEWGGNWMGVRLQYVHQLQNLYFALTREELILQP